MEFIQDYATLLPRLLPPSIANPLLTSLTTALGIARTLQVHLSPLVTRLLTDPDVATVLTVVVIFLVSLKILDMMYRAVMFWVNMAIKLALWGSVFLLGVWMWHRGIDGFVDDIVGLAQYSWATAEKFGWEVKKFQEQEKGQIRVKAVQRQGWR